MSARAYRHFQKFIFILVAVLGLATTSSHAAEVIKRFHSYISILPNGDLKVTETIKVVSEGDQIKRGFYRDFPTLIDDGAGRKKRVMFDVLEVKRDGRTEPWVKVKGANATRLYIGDKNVFLDRGLYTYQITYLTDRQLRFFDSHDELYWNVNGTEWEFPVDQVTATVDLPQGVRALEVFVFTGKFGSKEKFALGTISDLGRRVNFLTTQKLKAREGLTIGIKMPKGSFESASGSKGLTWFWRDYWIEICALLLLFIVVTYYGVLWWRIGRDPKRGVVIPRWNVPMEMSPALVSYIEEKGFGSSAWKALTAALLNLAVKGYIVLEDLDNEPIITQTKREIYKELPVGEASIISSLADSGSSSFAIKRSNGISVKSMYSRFKIAMEREHRNVYYRHNWIPILFGFFISIAGTVLLFKTGDIDEVMTLVGILLIPSGVVSVFLLSFIGRILHKYGTPMARTVSVSLLVGLGFIALAIGIISLPDLIVQPILMICFLGVVMANVLFFFLLGAPTQLGTEKMDILDGLRTYLQFAEKDRLNLAGAPSMSPKHFETLLPYAVALGVEKPWSRAFNTWLVSAAAGAAVGIRQYSPDWYRGVFDGGKIDDTFGSISDSLESSFTAALPTPKSSSSGFSSSGGFSGGGGGGGGGGGW